MSRKLDNLILELRRTKPPVVKIPNTNVSIDIGDNVSKGVSDAIKESIGNLKMPEFGGFPEYPAFPEIPVPQVTVNVPEIKLPIIKVPKQETPIVNVPPAQITVEPTKVDFTKEMKVEGMDELLKSVNRETERGNVFDEVSSKNPLPIMVVDSKGKQISNFGGDFTAPSTVAIRVGMEAVSETNLLPVTTDGFAIPVFDTQEIDESLAPATTIITYKKDGTTVAIKTVTVLGTLTTISVSIP
jgi:hypothetical protein